MSTYTYPTVAISTFLVFTARRWGQAPTITLSNGATAGSEVVTVDTSNNITIQIQSGVSTNTQIKAAIAAHSITSGFSASDLVTVAITAGHETDTQVTCVSAALSGGVSTATKASLALAGLKYEAKTAGAAGNSIRVKYTSGGSLSVSVSTNDITVQLKNDSTSTNALVIAAVAASGPADALVSVVSSGEALSRVPTIDAAPAFVNLAGGLSAAVASVVVQDLTVSSDTSATGTSDNGRTLTYTTGATAGSEVVSGTTNISVQIQNAVSTATQIKSKLDGYAPMNGSQASGTVTVSSYAAMHLTAATGSVTVVDYLKLAPEAAVPSGTITFGSPSDNSTIVLTGLPTDGTKTFTKKTAVSEVKATGSITFGAPVDTDTVVVDGSTFTKATAISEVKATGSITYGIPVEGDTVIVDGTTLTYSTTPGAGIFASISELEVLVEAVAGLNSTEDGTTVSITSTLVGVLGNAQTLAVGVGNSGTLAVSGATLSGGVDAYVLGVTEFETIAQLEVLVEAVTGINSVVNVGDIDITSTLTGVLGNAQTLAVGVGNSGTLSVSGPTLTGGIDAYVLGPTEFEVIADLTALIQALTDLNASDNSTVITLVVVTKGTAMNSATVTGTSSYSALSRTFSGGTSTHAVLTVAGHALTEGAGWTAATDNDATATSLAAAVNALSEVSATATLAVISIVATPAGAAGNSVALVTSDAVNLTKSGALLTGGINAATVTVGATTLVESTDFNAVTSNDQTATNLASVINGLALVGASATLAVVTVTADATDVSGNSIALAKTGSGVAVSGAFLTGGVNGLTTTISGTGSNAQKTVNGSVMAGAVAPNVLGFFVDNSITALTSSYVYFPFAVRYNNIVLNNDETTGNKQVIFSWDGINNHGILDPGESVNLVNANRSSIFLKYGNAAPVYRVFGSGTF